MHRPPMVGYASRTGTRRNLDALARADWRLLVSAKGEHRAEGSATQSTAARGPRTSAGSRLTSLPFWQSSTSSVSALIGSSFRTSSRAVSRRSTFRCTGWSVCEACHRNCSLPCRTGCNWKTSRPTFLPSLAFLSVDQRSGRNRLPKRGASLRVDGTVICMSVASTRLAAFTSVRPPARIVSTAAGRAVSPTPCLASIGRLDSRIFLLRPTSRWKTLRRQVAA